MGALVPAGSSWATTDNLARRYSHVQHLVQELGFDEGYTRIIADVTHLGPSDLYLKMFGAVGEEMGVPARDVNLAMLQSTWRVVTPSGAPPRRVRLLQHPEADWFEQALQRFVSDIADRVVLRDPIGQPLSYPWGDLPPFHAHFTDAGPPPGRVAFCEALERVLLFCTAPYREYRDLLQVTFSREATRLSVASAANEKALNETLHVKKWTDVQMHGALMNAQKTSGIFLPYSMLNNLAAATALVEGLKQSPPRFSVSHHGKRKVGCMRPLTSTCVPIFKRGRLSPTVLTCPCCVQ